MHSSEPVFPILNQEVEQDIRHEPVFPILNQEVEQDIRHVDVVFHYIFMYLPSFKLMMLVSN
jgi:hypothetical protein